MTCRGIRNKANITWFISFLRRLGGPCWGRGYCAIFYGNNQVKKRCFLIIFHCKTSLFANSVDKTIKEWYNEQDTVYTTLLCCTESWFTIRNRYLGIYHLDSKGFTRRSYAAKQALCIPSIHRKSLKEKVMKSVIFRMIYRL